MEINQREMYQQYLKFNKRYWIAFAVTIAFAGMSTIGLFIFANLINTLAGESAFYIGIICIGFDYLSVIIFGLVYIVGNGIYLFKLLLQAKCSFNSQMFFTLMLMCMIFSILVRLLQWTNIKIVF